MKNVVNISLASLAFVFEEKAYVALRDYIDSLERYYKNSVDGKEIVSDIEARVAELILMEQESSVVVGERLVESIISRLGAPEEAMGYVEYEAEAPPIVNTFDKRLYRNPENRRIGGVMGGLAVFFGGDPVWWRLGFFIPLVLLVVLSPLSSKANGFLGALFGVEIIVYFLMWIVVPKAKTPRQKLEMEGKKVTVTSIEQRINNDFNNDPKGEPIAKFISFIFQMLLFCVRLAAMFIGVIMAVVAVLLLIAIGALLLGSFSGVEALYFVEFRGMSMELWFALVLLAIFMTLILIGVFASRVIFSTRANRSFIAVLIGIWIIINTFAIVTAIRNRDHICTGLKDLSKWEKIGTLKNVKITKEIVIGSDSTYNYSVEINVHKEP